MISLSTKSLQSAISKAKAIAPTSTTLDILKSVMLQGRPENAWLTLTSTNLDAQISVDVDADVTEQIACCVDLSRFSTAIDVPGDETKIVIDGERLKVSTGRSVFRLPTRPVEDFPTATSHGETLAAFKCEWLGPILSRFVPFAAENDIRTYLNAVCIRNVGGALTISASDGHMAAMMERETEEKRDFDLLIPIRIARALATYEPTRAIVKNGGVTFLGENTQVTSRLVEGRYPDMKAHFGNAQFDGEFTVKRADAIRATKSCAAMSDGKIRAVRLGSTNDTPFIETPSINGSGGEARVDLAGSVTEGFGEIGFMDRVLLTLLDSSDEAEVTLKRQGVDRLYLTDGDFRAVGMAMRL